MRTTIFYQVLRRRIRLTTLAVMGFVMVITGTFFSVAGTAHADVPEGFIKHVYINLNTTSNWSVDEYTQFINSLRQAAGHHYRANEFETQRVARTNNRPDHYRNGLIMATLTYEGTPRRTVTLWLTPADLYVRGFTNDVNGQRQTFEFDDSSYSLSTHFSRIHDRDSVSLLRIARTGRVRVLPFSGNYDSLSGRNGARRGREEMPISFEYLTSAVAQLAGTTNPYGQPNQQEVARSLMLMIQYTSEAVRFHHVFQVMQVIMSNDSYYHGLPLRDVRLENSWGRISNFGYAISGNPSAPALNVTGVGTLHSFTDVQNTTPIILNRNNWGMVSGNPGNSQF